MYPRLIVRLFLAANLAVGFATFGGTLPDASRVASQINERVTFEDKITAVSRSRTGDGYYVNFGAPFPKQVLSVWVPGEMFDKIPHSGSLLGRTVRVDGLIQTSSTGPLIDLESAEHFHLLPVNESILSEPQLGGRTHRQQFIAAIRQYLAKQDFDTIETLGNELHQSRERFTDGTWMLDAFFDAFDLSSKTATKVYDERAAVIGRWKSRYPGSIMPVLVEANYHKDLAWKARGTAYADKVTAEGWRQFSVELGEARRILESNPQAKASPLYFSVMQTIALGQAWKKEDYFKLFSEAVALEPDYYGFYFEAAYYLLPKWFGKKGEWERFAEEQREKLGGPAGDALYARIAWSKEGEFRPHLFDKTAISWKTMAAGFDAMLQQYPNSDFNRNAYAYFAWEAKDRERLRPALEAVKANPDMEIWVNLENFQFAEKFANSESSTPSAQ